MGGIEHACSVHPSAKLAVDQHFDCARACQNSRKLGQNKIDFLPIFRMRILVFVNTSSARSHGFGHLPSTIGVSCNSLGSTTTCLIRSRFHV